MGGATYFLWTVPFLTAVLALDTLILKTWVIKKRDFWIVLGVMLGFTAIFDQLLTGLPIVLYDFTKTSGIKVWHAPIEDFTYTIAAVIGVGSALSYATKKQK